MSSLQAGLAEEQLPVGLAPEAPERLLRQRGGDADTDDVESVTTLTTTTAAKVGNQDTTHTKQASANATPFFNQSRRFWRKTEKG